MIYAFKRITIPDDWLGRDLCKLFSITMPKGSIVLRVSCGNGCYMHIQYPKDNSNAEEEVWFYIVPIDRFGEFEEMTMDIPEDMESYQLTGNFSRPVMVFALRNR